MMHLDVGGKLVPIAAGETLIGSAPGCAIVLEGQGVRPHHAVLRGTTEGAAAIRAAEPEATLIINGIRLGGDPTPVLHGDKIQIGTHELLAVDPRRSGSTQLFDSGAFADLVPPPPPKSTRGEAGARVVCLTDGREYTISGEPLVFGRDAASDVVVGGNEVSRKHAEIRPGPEGHVLVDLSVNGTYVNGQKVDRIHELARADVIRIGHDEFRFYSDTAPLPGSRPPRPPPPPEETPLRPPTGAGHRLSDTMHGLPVSQLQGVVTPRVAMPAPLASLLIRSGSLKGQRLPVQAPVVNIGRADYNDVVISEPSVSTTHAKLQRREALWVLSDLGSTNGTFVEGERITEEAPLTPGTTLRFGEVAVLFEPLDDQAPVARPAGTQVLDRVETPAAAPAEPRRRPRPVRAAAPRPSGPPAWLVALLVLAGFAIAYFLLR
jgi:pSer/pThr/pTyr-binding forkhead associated (FHA) protein